MREILFRGKRIDNGEWVYGDICHHDGVVSYIGQHPADGSMVCYDIGPETVGQFTGLTDKNGKRIFEGDVCLCDRNIAPSVDERKFEIVFDVQQGEWFGEGWSSSIEAYQFGICEVIGSIHDNPELLEVSGDE